MVNRLALNEGPLQATPPPNWLTAKGPCKICTAWFVTLPVADADGPAMFVFCGACSASPLLGKDRNTSSEAVSNRSAFNVCLRRDTRS